MITAYDVYQHDAECHQNLAPRLDCPWTNSHGSKLQRSNVWVWHTNMRTTLVQQQDLWLSLQTSTGFDPGLNSLEAQGFQPAGFQVRASKITSCVSKMSIEHQTTIFQSWAHLDSNFLASVPSIEEPPVSGAFKRAPRSKSSNTSRSSETTATLVSAARLRFTSCNPK